MRLSSLFVPLRKEAPHDEVSRNAQLLLRAGYVEKLMAGVYTLLPLGLMVLRNIESIIRTAMDELGANELRMPALHPRSVWDETGRWRQLASIMYQFHDHGQREVGLGTTHEEIITAFVRHHVQSYRDLPIALYQIQTKFRDEPRPKSGLIRLREFTMKDLYSFHADEADLDEYYERVKNAYASLFHRCGLEVKVIEASGGDFSKSHSHEFSVLTDAGEDRVICCPTCAFGQNSEIATRGPGDACPNGDGKLLEAKAVEVGNVFKLGTRFSEAMGAVYRNAEGQARPVFMASYGIGLERVLATIVEVSHDAQGIRWPLSVTPFLATVIGLGSAAAKRAERLLEACQKKTLPVLYADRSESAGALFATADLLGFPVRLVFSEKTGEQVEWTTRGESSRRLSQSASLKRLQQLSHKRHAR